MSYNFFPSLIWWPPTHCYSDLVATRTFSNVSLMMSSSTSFSFFQILSFWLFYWLARNASTIRRRPFDISIKEKDHRSVPSADTNTIESDIRSSNLHGLFFLLFFFLSLYIDDDDFNKKIQKFKFQSRNNRVAFLNQNISGHNQIEIFENIPTEKGRVKTDNVVSWSADRGARCPTRLEKWARRELNKKK